jgi:predicted ATP-dependent serine protease
MIELKGSRKEQAVRGWFNDQFNGVVPNSKVIDLFKRFEVEVPGISYGCLNGTMKKIVAEGHVDMSAPKATGTTESPAKKEPVVAEIVTVEDMDFPDFGLHRTGKEIDHLFSDHEEGGGQYGGTVTIVIGESGVGKSTILLDALASIQAVNPDAKVLYVSSEMTKNDIGFYYRKTPAIGKVPTLLLMSHVKDGSLDQVIQDEFNRDYDIILLDSYQDVVVKLKEVKGWKSTYAESWLTNIMIDAAENNGAAIWAIQHMTKGGQYVGSTYLKHATTAMLEIMFDEAGQRYVEFSKNRRGGSAVGKRLYFRLIEGDVVYDSNRFKETEELRDIEDKESMRQTDLSKKFEEIFVFGARDASSDEEEDKEENQRDIELEIIETKSE